MNWRGGQMIRNLNTKVGPSAGMKTLNKISDDTEKVTIDTKLKDIKKRKRTGMNDAIEYVKCALSGKEDSSDIINIKMKIQ
ncbi:hypothetical protein PGB90_010262 [Kerria lacca]